MKRLDQKKASILNDPFGAKDIIIVDAKDTDIVELLVLENNIADLELKKQFPGCRKQTGSVEVKGMGRIGLGLALSHRLADAMGGTIAGDSVPGKGSTFPFRLPIQSAPPIPATPSGREGAFASCPDTMGAILVVEDDYASSLLARRVLEAIGWRVEFAADGSAAIGLFASQRYSAILMDMQMPVMDGLDATRRIREIEEFTGSHVPIIALTATAMPGDRERCFAAGMDDYLSKPFKKDQLSDKLANLM